MKHPQIIAPEESFNTQPPEGGWTNTMYADKSIEVSTHSRLKAAGLSQKINYSPRNVSTHSRLKAAGFCLLCTLGSLGGFNT